VPEVGFELSPLCPHRRFPVVGHLLLPLPCQVAPSD
jgi:hypothetical protein